MRITMSFVGAVAVALVGLIPDDALAQRRDRDRDRGRDQQSWEQLGVATIGVRVERDIIEVGRREGRFEKIQFEVKQNDVEIIDLKVIYGNGETEDVRVREQFRAGSRSRPIDLDGRGRFIKQIEVAYRARGPVEIVFFGEQARRGRDRRADGRWDELGCQKVGFLADRDVIRVGRREGRYRAIKLAARNNKIRMLSLKVIYANGAPDDIPVRTVIPAGRETEPLDLQGRRRAIDRIEMVYLSKFSFKGPATVCAYGLH